MEIVARNPHSALGAFLQQLVDRGTKHEDQLVFPEPCTFAWQLPKERLIFWDGMLRDPAQELQTAAHGLAEAEAVLELSAQKILKGNRQLLFATPELAVQGQLDTNKRFRLVVALATSNPFIGAFGQYGLQISMMQELMAKSIKKPVGPMVMIHMAGVQATTLAVGGLLEEIHKRLAWDPYAEKFVKPRDLDGPLELKMLSTEGPMAMGYKSKWVRHVAVPLLEILKAQREDTDIDIEKTTKRIKASDWRMAMELWSDRAKPHAE
jgi:hypothetical protein